MGNVTAKENGVMASFISPYVKNITSLKVNFSPIQEGSGDPSPTNIRPISGWNSIDINVAGENLLNATIHTVNFSNDIGTVYGGSLDFITGELIVDKIGITFDGTESSWIRGGDGDNAFYRWYYYDDTIKAPSSGALRGCSHFNNAEIYTSTSYIGYIAYTSPSAPNQGWVNIRPDLSQISTLEQWKTFLAEQYANGTPVQCWFTKTTPVTYQLTPQQLQTFKGYNNIWSNADSVEVEYELAETFDIQKAKRKIILNQPHTESISDDIVHFKTDMKAPLKECVVNFSPIQEGTGTPSTTNIRPIKGFDDIYLIRCGKNLLRPFSSGTSGGITWTTMDDGSVHASGEKTSSGTLQRTSFVNPGYIPGSPAAGTMTNDFNKGIMLKYGGSWNPDGKKYFDIYPWDITTSARPKQTSTSTTNAVSVYYDTDVAKAYLPANHVFRASLRCNTMNVTYDDYVFHPWVYFDDEEDETFEKPMREEVDIPFDSIGTIYGGSLDLITGTLTTDYAFIELDGTESWASNQGDSEQSKYFRLLLPKSVLVSSNYRGCSHYSNVNVLTTTTQVGFHAYTSSNGGNKNLRFRPNLSEISDLEQWKNFLAEQKAAGTPVQCWWRYTEPVTYQLTPQQILTLKGTNNIWSNANGDVEIKYWTH